MVKLPKELATVTPLSKILAVILFVVFPFVGFFFGMRYQEMADLAKSQEENNVSISRVATPAPDETANWKTYTNSEFGFEIKYPSNLYLRKEGWEDTQRWSISWANLQDDKVKVKTSSNSTGIDHKDLYALNYCSIYINIIEKPVHQEPFSTNKEAVTEQNLQRFVAMTDPKKIKHVNFQDRPSIGKESTFVSGYTLKDIGGSVEYYILDGARLFELTGLCQDLQKNPISNIDQILSTFKFTDQASSEGKFCGGIAGVPCSEGYKCQLDGTYPDAGGKCVKL